MAFNRSTWTKLSFRNSKNAPWPCPRCSGPLSYKESRFIVKSSSDLPQTIQHLTKDEIHELGYCELRFSGILMCDGCDLPVATSGFAYNTDRLHNAVSASYRFSKGRVLIPIHFN